MEEFKEPPSPLQTEHDGLDDENGPSSVEAQADASDLGFDLDLDLPSTSYPLASPQPSTSNDIFAENTEENPFLDLFNESGSGSAAAEPDVKVEGAVAGVCGFYNFANTCYMNSGLQCLLATPTIVKFFTENYEEKEEKIGLLSYFQPILRDVWAGDYALLKPLSFKETLSGQHAQFSGAHQHDCQEFLALLLDAMHEELKMSNKINQLNKYEISDCGTSMELHTAQSTEKDNAMLSMSWLSRNSSLDNDANTAKRINQSEIETEGSASPKSYDSRSSVEDKVAQSIRQLPIPKTLKVPLDHRGSGSEEESMEDYDNDVNDMDEDTMDSNGSSVNHPTSNLIPTDSLKRVHSSSVTHANVNAGAVQFTKESQSQDLVINNEVNDFYVKDSKTLNVNVLANNESEEMNNEITFDSEKYANLGKIPIRPKNTIENNLTVENTLNATVKNVKSHNDCNGVKRIRLDSSDKEKNILMERQVTGATALIPTSPTLDQARLKEAVDADRFWDKHLGTNDTVIARTFQGQFKSSVTCKSCKYVSVNFEPFMYLPVPLPDANIRQVEVTFITPENPPLKLMLEMTQTDNVGHLKSKLIEELKFENCLKFQFAEVYEHHISRVIDDWTLLKCLKDDANREIYAINLVEYQETEKSEGDLDQLEKINEQGDQDEKLTEFQSCVICMEDLPGSELRQHNACDCVMCNPCLERTVDHHINDSTVTPNHIKCPGCRQETDPETEFVTLDLIGKSKPKLRIFTLPVLHRSFNNGVFGHPTLIQVPNQILGKHLHSLLKPFCISPNYKLVLVNSSGKNCSRCIFNTKCFGCYVIGEDSMELLQVTDSIAIEYEDQVFSEEVQAIDHESMSKPRVKAKLDLYDCLEAFSTTEELDETNPWYCPQCRKNKCATKTLSVWRFPDYLIIYLKRFIFTNASASKLEKEVEFSATQTLDLTAYMSGPLQSDSRPQFNMYGCVCHFGSVLGGHYTAFAKHLGSHQWNYFDDSSIHENKIPGETLGDFSSAYILFYQRSGSKQDNLIPLLSRKCRAFALNNDKMSEDHNNEEEDLNNKVGNAVGVSEDLDFEASKPDLSQIIRSLDTPPPSS